MLFNLFKSSIGPFIGISLAYGIYHIQNKFGILEDYWVELAFVTFLLPVLILNQFYLIVFQKRQENLENNLDGIQPLIEGFIKTYGDHITESTSKTYSDFEGEMKKIKNDIQVLVENEIIHKNTFFSNHRFTSHIDGVLATYVAQPPQKGDVPKDKNGTYSEIIDVIKIDSHTIRFQDLVLSPSYISFITSRSKQVNNGGRMQRLILMDLSDFQLKTSRHLGFELYINLVEGLGFENYFFPTNLYNRILKKVETFDHDIFNCLRGIPSISIAEEAGKGKKKEIEIIYDDISGPNCTLDSSKTEDALNIINLIVANSSPIDKSNASLDWTSLEGKIDISENILESNLAHGKGKIVEKVEKILS